MNKEKTKKLLASSFLHKDLILFAKEKLNIQIPKKIKTKKSLVDFIVLTIDEEVIIQSLKPPTPKAPWKKRIDHFYGICSAIGLLLSILFFGVSSRSSVNEVSIIGKVVQGNTPLVGADISLPQLNLVAAKSGNLGGFTFPPISEERLPSDSLQLRVIFDEIEKNYFFPISEKKSMDNIIIDVYSDRLIFFDSTKFSILILPFQLLQNCTIKETGIEETIRTRLNSMAEFDSLNIEVTTLLAGIKCPKTYNEARDIGNMYNANLVVWGDLYENCFSDSLKSCVKYAVIDTPIKSLNEKGETSIRRNTLDNIGRGELQLDVDYIIYYSLALEASFEDNHALSISYCEKIINDIDPTSASTYTTLGYSYYKEGDELGAELSFIKAISFDSTKSGAYMNLGMLYHEQKKYPLAEKNFQTAILNDPNNPQIRSAYGSLLINLKEYEKAEKEIKKSISLDPKHISGYVTLGNFYTHTQKNNQPMARYYYKKALKINPNFKLAHFIRHNFGRTYLQEGKLDSAEFYLRKNLELSPNFAASYFVLGQVYIERENLDSAQSLYLKSCKLMPEWRTPRFDSIFQISPPLVN